MPRTPSQDVEQALLDAAEAVLVRDGVAGVTVRAVAAQAGVAPMGVYNRFGGKDGLVGALVARSFELLAEAVTSRGELDPRVRLHGCGERYREFALTHPQHYRVIFGGLPTGFQPPPPGHEPPDDPVHQEVAEKAGAAFGALVDSVVYGMEQGVIAPADPMDLAMQIWSSVHGAVMLELAGLVLTPDPAATYGRLLDLLVTAVAGPAG